MPQEKLRKNMRFPLILKLNAEGSSKGISETGLVHDYDEYKKELDRLFSIYDEPVLVEEFIKGREFTIGVLQEGNKYRVLPIMEIHFKHGKEFYSYKVKKNSDYYVNYTCPAKIEPTLEKRLTNMAIRICKTLEIKDVARMDLRVSQEDGNPYFLEINPLPGMAKGFSDLPRIAEIAGFDYEDLVLHILDNAVQRNGLLDHVHV
ncbi:MAG: ATP-grasp domain-containing protein [Pseudothermotoga sp.]